MLMMALSISQTSILALFFSPFDALWHSNFIIDICLKNVCTVLTVTGLIIVVQLIVYRYIGDRVSRHHKTIAAVLTAVCIVTLAVAVIIPASQFKYSASEFNTYESDVESTKEPTETDKVLLPYYDEFSSSAAKISGTTGSICHYSTKNDQYITVFQDGEGDKRYIVEYFCSDSKTLRSKFHQEVQFYPPTDAINGEQNGIRYTAFYEREKIADAPFVTFELALESENAVCFISIFNTDDVMNENTQALIDTAVDQFQQFSIIE